MSNRPEIEIKAFAKTVESQPIATIPFDSKTFGNAANNCQMIAEISASHRAAKTFLQVARRLTGRPEPKKARGAFLQPIISKLRRGAA
jgi:pilus assembly protein CpaE